MSKTMLDICTSMIIMTVYCSIAWVLVRGRSHSIFSTDVLCLGLFLMSCDHWIFPPIREVVVFSIKNFKNWTECTLISGNTQSSNDLKNKLWKQRISDGEEGVSVSERPRTVWESRYRFPNAKILHIMLRLMKKITSASLGRLPKMLPFHFLW